MVLPRTSLAARTEAMPHGRRGRRNVPHLFLAQVNVYITIALTERGARGQTSITISIVTATFQSPLVLSLRDLIYPRREDRDPPVTPTNHQRDPGYNF